MELGGIGAMIMSPLGAMCVVFALYGVVMVVGMGMDVEVAACHTA
jgi:hypothetical protein